VPLEPSRWSCSVCVETVHGHFHTAELLSATNMPGPGLAGVDISGANFVPVPLPQGRMDDSLLGWAIDPSEITISQRKDGSDWVLGAGTYGKVRVSRQIRVQKSILSPSCAARWITLSFRPIGVAHTPCLHRLYGAPSLMQAEQTGPHCKASLGRIRRLCGCIRSHIGIWRHMALQHRK